MNMRWHEEEAGTEPLKRTPSLPAQRHLIFIWCGVKMESQWPIVRTMMLLSVLEHSHPGKCGIFRSGIKEHYDAIINGHKHFVAACYDLSDDEMSDTFGSSRT